MDGDFKEAAKLCRKLLDGRVHFSAIMVAMSRAKDLSEFFENLRMIEDLRTSGNIYIDANSGDD